MSQEQLERYFKDTIELITNKSKDFYEENEITEEEYKTSIGDILKTFTNKFYSYQNEILFSSVNDINLNFRVDKPKLNKFDFDTSKCFTTDIGGIKEEADTDIISPEPFNVDKYFKKINLNDFENDNIKNKTKSYTYNDEYNYSDTEDGLNYCNFEIPRPGINKVINNDEHYYSSDPEFETQCCARISNEWFKIDDYSSEFLDKYPAGVFITTDGYVVGKPCYNMIPDEDYEGGKIFCDEHCNSKYEDIREAPSILDSDT